MLHPLAEILAREHAKGKARPLVIASVEFLAGFEPVPAKCHDNAKRWVERHPEYRVAEGWFPVDPTWSHFIKHSVVTKGDGQVICVTLDPQGNTAPCRFIEHDPAWDPTPFAGLPPQVTVDPFRSVR